MHELKNIKNKRKELSQDIYRLRMEIGEFDRRHKDMEPKLQELENQLRMKQSLLHEAKLYANKKTGEAMLFTYEANTMFKRWDMMVQKNKEYIEALCEGIETKDMDLNSLNTLEIKLMELLRETRMYVEDAKERVRIFDTETVYIRAKLEQRIKFYTMFDKWLVERSELYKKAQDFYKEHIVQEQHIQQDLKEKQEYMSKNPKRGLNSAFIDYYTSQKRKWDREIQQIQHMQTKADHSVYESLEREIRKDKDTIDIITQNHHKLVDWANHLSDMQRQFKQLNDNNTKSEHFYLVDSHVLESNHLNIENDFKKWCQSNNANTLIFNQIKSHLQVSGNTTDIFGILKYTPEYVEALLSKQI